MAKKKSKVRVKFELHKPLRQAMEERGLTEDDLAKQTGLSLHAVRLVLSGSLRATVRALHAVGWALGFRIDLRFHKPSLLEKIAEAASE